MLLISTAVHLKRKANAQIDEESTQPLTRIEEHLRCEININSSGIITNTVSSGTLFRGLEIILKNRDPRDTWAFAERICGVCT